VKLDNSSAADVLLASKSPRRRELLRQIGVRFTCISVYVPEEREPEESPRAYVERLAESKAAEGLRCSGGSVPVLGADTIVVMDEQVLEKPRDQHDAVAMLLSLSARVHRVMTAVSLCTADRSLTRCSSTEVRFRAITSDEAERYWHTGEPLDKAGAYGIQGMAAVFVEHIAGSYSAVVGLPLFETQQLLQAFAVPVWNRL